MTQQIINIGTAPNDGTGDPARTAFTKSNDNFTELYARGTVAAPQGRLTLQTVTPVMTTSQAGKTTIFYTNYVGNLIPLFDGVSSFAMTTFAELSCTTTDTTKNPSAIGASKINDWFVWNDAGTMRLSHGPDWTSDTVRSAGTALVSAAGVWVNNAAITNACAATRGTYVGTTRSGSGSTLAFILGGDLTAGFLGVWNCYNRVQAYASVTDSTANWTYGSSTYRNRNSHTSAHIDLVVGLEEDAIEAVNAGYGTTDSGSNSPVNAIALDVVTSLIGVQSQGTNTASANASLAARWKGTLLGYRLLIAAEAANNAGSPTWLGRVASAPIRLFANFYVTARM